MMKNKSIKAASLLVLLTLLFLLPSVSLSEEPEILRGYFTGNKLIRPVMIRAGEIAGTIPAYQPVELTVINQHWGSLTMENGKTGYLFYDGILPMPEFEALPEKEMYSGSSVPVRGLPMEDAPAVGELGSWTVCVLDGRSDGWDHVRLPESGLTGYVPEGSLEEPVFELPEAPVPVTVMAAVPAELTVSPLRGAAAAGVLEAECFFTAYEVGFDEHLALIGDDSVTYVRKNNVCACELDPESGIPLFLFFSEEDSADPVFSYAYTSESGAVLRAPGSEEIQLSAGERVFVYMEYADLASVSAGDRSGYVSVSALTEETVEMKKAALQSADLSGATVTRNEYLDQAFAMLEEKNSVLLRYNAATGADIQALFPLGVPYFWGGRSYNILRGRYPEYSTLSAWQSSPLYYRKGTVYLYGFDCVGFVKAVCSLAKHPVNVALRDLITWQYCNAGRHVYCQADHPMPDDWAEAARGMQPGDILVVFHPGEHVMMYIGTLRQYGYTEEDLPQMADYLDYPLMIQSGEDPFCYLRYTDYILNSEDEKIQRAVPADGGVGLAILGIAPEDAEYIISAPHQNYPCFLIEGTCVNVFDFSRVTNYIVYRQ